MPKVFLHIGVHKTGTTSIQRFLHDNAAMLGLQRWIVPTHLRSYGEVTHVPLAWAAKEGNASLWRNILSRVKDCSDRLLISSEEFEYLDTKAVEFLASVLVGFDVTVLAYVRRQDEIIESEYLEWVKNGSYCGEPYVFFRNNDLFERLNYDKLAERWAGVFGKENVQIRKFDPLLFKNDGIVGDFASAIGINMDGLTEPGHYRDNERMDLRRLLVTRFFSAYIDMRFGVMPTYDIQSKRWEAKAATLRDAVSRVFKDEVNSPYKIMSFSERQEVLERFGQSNKILFERFLVDQQPWVIAPEKEGGGSAMEQVVADIAACDSKAAIDSLIFVQGDTLHWERVLSGLHSGGG